MPWTITESQTPQAPVKPPGMQMVWEDVPVGSWAWLVEDGAYGIKVGFDLAECGRQSVGMGLCSPCIPCPPDWRFEARVVDGTLRFVPMVEVAKEDEWFEVGSVDLDEGDLVQDAVGGWHVGNGSGGIACLIRCGYCTKFRRPRGPVALTYTP